ncbi:MAG: hypothetical protein Q3966_04010 [Neisseria sp.]|nr:hypothetical protein [Neisseria sp.]
MYWYTMFGRRRGFAGRLKRNLRKYARIKIQSDPKGKEKAVQLAKKDGAYGKLGGIITEAEFDIGRHGGRYEFEILSGGRKFDVDAMSGLVLI